MLISAGSIFSYWPGFLSPDSANQLAQAISGHYHDHHPPLMAFYWRLWLWWKPGPEPVFLTQQLILFISTFIFLKAFKDKKISFCIPFIPLIPHVFSYSGALWKDVGMAFPYLLSASILCFHSIKKLPLSKSYGCIVWILLFYGTGVKYQGIFILPIMALWVSITLNRSLPYTIIIWFALWGSIISANYAVKELLVGKTKEDHSWQKVKLYDLAGISVQLDKDLFPPFVRKNPAYSFAKVKAVYSPIRVDELLIGWGPKGSLQQGENQGERSLLWDTWFNAVKTYPLFYFKHRFNVWKTMVNRPPLKSFDELKDIPAIPLRIYKLLHFSQKIGMVAPLQKVFRFIYCIPFMVAYLILGILFLRRNSVYAVPLIFMNLTGLTLLGALFIFSMASDLRYIYLTMIFFHFSHPLAWGTLFYGKKKKN